jgi:hypothetical protein
LQILPPSPVQSYEQRLFHFTADIFKRLDFALRSITNLAVTQTRTWLNSTQFFTLCRMVKESGAESQPLQRGNHHNIVTVWTSVAGVAAWQKWLESQLCPWQYFDSLLILTRLPASFRAEIEVGTDIQQERRRRTQDQLGITRPSRNEEEQ